MPEQTLDGIPLGLGMVMKINFFEFSYSLNLCKKTDNSLQKFLPSVCWVVSVKKLQYK